MKLRRAAISLATLMCGLLMVVTGLSPAPTLYGWVCIVSGLATMGVSITMAMDN